MRNRLSPTGVCPPRYAPPPVALLTFLATFPVLAADDDVETILKRFLEAQIKNAERAGQYSYVEQARLFRLRQKRVILVGTAPPRTMSSSSKGSRIRSSSPATTGRLLRRRKRTSSAAFRRLQRSGARSGREAAASDGKPGL